MSALWLNIRFWRLHLQIGEPYWWSVRVRYNSYAGLIWRRDGLLDVCEAPWLMDKARRERDERRWRNVKINKEAR